LQQSALIGQLQEQHYQQYMSQVYQQQAASMQQQANDTNPAQTSPGVDNNHAKVKHNSGETDAQADTDGDSEQQSEAGEDVPCTCIWFCSNHVQFFSAANPNMAPASMWTRKDIAEFKRQIATEGAEGIIKVGHGETVTVRVPTHEDGSCLFWEFATDHYDIGFGVYFEWTIADSNTVTVHISESSDEDDELGRWCLLFVNSKLN
jgi:hypothetical protein